MCLLAAGDDLNDLWVLDAPNHVFWPTNAALGLFFDIYDWDLVELIPFMKNVLPYHLVLCSGVFPCTFSLQGGAATKMYLSANGAISCLASLGCSSLTLSNIWLECNSSVRQLSAIELQGSELHVIDSTIIGCSSANDGGSIQTYGEKAFAEVKGSAIKDSWSGRYGGAISSVGSVLVLLDSTFQNCTSSKGGGAIYAADYVCYPPQRGIVTAVSISNCKFKSCKTRSSGGAVLATSSTDTANVTAEIYSCEFEGCVAEMYGGCIFTSSLAVSIQITDSVFQKSESILSGGAISVQDLSKVSMMKSVFKNNTAGGNGGGAIQLDDAFLSLDEVTFIANSAPTGGGGALFWDGSFEPDVQDQSVLRAMCVCDNFAAYGPCVGSIYRTLVVSGLPSSKDPAYPGIPILIKVLKIDVYNQTIASDSSSLVEVKTSVGESLQEDSQVGLSGSTVEKLDRGEALFSLVIKPLFSEVTRNPDLAVLASQPYIYVQGSDYQTGMSMQSLVFKINLSNGSKICPSGYILVLGQTTALESALSGVCLQCGPGTYSVDPLAGYGRDASCLNCPQNSQCHGGDSVEISSLGLWVIRSGMYRLIACPSGYQLINSIDGVFSHDIQQCVACSSSEYILDSNNSNYTCQQCPVGAICDGSTLQSVVPGSLWLPDWEFGQYLLKSCPPGYELLNTQGDSNAFSYGAQECSLCPDTTYCLGGTSLHIPCPENTFSLPGSNSSSSCFAVIYVELTVWLPIAKSNFTPATQVLFAQALADTVVTPVGRVLIQSITTNRRSEMPSIQIISDIATNSDQDANEMSTTLTISALNFQLTKQGLPSLSKITVTILSNDNQEQSTLKLIAALIPAFMGALILPLALLMYFRWFMSGASRRLIGAKKGTQADQRDLPYELRSKYEALRVIGCGSYGFVLEAWQLNTGKRNIMRAVKIVHSHQKRFSEKELRRLDREVNWSI